MRRGQGRSGALPYNGADILGMRPTLSLPRGDHRALVDIHCRYHEACTSSSSKKWQRVRACVCGESWLMPTVQESGNLFDYGAGQLEPKNPSDVALSASDCVRLVRATLGDGVPVETFVT